MTYTTPRIPLKQEGKDSIVSTQQTTWTLIVSSRFVSQPPRFNFGDFVPLGEELQPTPGVTYFGQIKGMWVEHWSDAPNEWTYVIELPSEHPDGESNEWLVFRPESDLKEFD